jgi:hypothetical protein
MQLAALASFHTEARVVNSGYVQFVIRQADASLGRSLSNLLAFMIETKLQDYKQGKA